MKTIINFFKKGACYHRWAIIDKMTEVMETTNSKNEVYRMQVGIKYFFVCEVCGTFKRERV